MIALDLREPEGDVDRYLPVDLADRRSIDEALEAVPDGSATLFSRAGLTQTSPADQVLIVNFVGSRHPIEQARPKMER